MKLSCWLNLWKFYNKSVAKEKYLFAGNYKLDNNHKIIDPNPWMYLGYHFAVKCSLPSFVLLK